MMFQEMNRKDKTMNDKEAKDVLSQGEYGILSMQGDYPYGIPVSYVFFNDAVYIHCAIKGLKNELIQKCGKVCFTVVGDAKTIPEKITVQYKSVVLFGKAVFLEGEEKLEALIEFCKKYSPGYLDKNKEKINNCPLKAAVIKITVDHLSGKQSGF